MKIFVAIDDTDNIESRGTGALAEILSHTPEQRNWGKGSAVTRHQMLIHPDIPYTSHNSAMCFTAEIKKHVLDEFILKNEEMVTMGEKVKAVLLGNMSTMLVYKNYNGNGAGIHLFV